MTNQENAQTLWELIKDIKFAMLTTMDEDGTLRSRPMTTQQEPFDGDLWFFTPLDSAKVREINTEHQVNVSYADPGKHTYVSVCGVATLVRDRQKIEKFWNPSHKIWFPEGKDGPNLALLRVQVEKAEYWDSADNPVVRMIEFVKSAVTGNPQEMGENEKLTF